MTTTDIGTYLVPRYSPARPLTGRQRTIVVCVVGGAGYKQIAARLGISVRTVRQHVENIAAALPGEGAPRNRVMAWAHELLKQEAA
jgi:DNA-binding NarL/FixJ family response regulator